MPVLTPVFLFQGYFRIAGYTPDTCAFVACSCRVLVIRVVVANAPTTMNTK